MVQVTLSLPFNFIFARNSRGMDTRRQLKIGSVIREVFTDYLLREGKHIYGNALVTVTNVKVTPDLTIARFYLSIYNTREPDVVLQKFEEHTFEIKRALAAKLRHELRRIPEIEFYRDDTLDQVFHLENVFKKIKEEDARISALREAHEVNQEKKAPNKK
ncbi:MAG: 30S ribosome-binding factor RbfA [Chitinophagales bacterium]|nr:30S ribosome-binding factor RbfA [Chitinophagales bacterium]MDW8418338.1 30S ribosome-binding factor RbfA [Chitinophagales bacterium]